jgi:hypothetical protein
MISLPKLILWLESAIELYRPSDRRLSAKLVPTFEDRRVRRIPYGLNLGFLDRGMISHKSNLGKHFHQCYISDVLINCMYVLLFFKFT